MDKKLYKIEQNVRLTSEVYRLVLVGDTSAITAPGQFVNIELEGLYLRRPISVCDLDGQHLTLIYKIVGKGTQQLRHMKPGTALDLLTGLGNGYCTDKCGQEPLLIGGGVGVPPLYLLAKILLALGKKPKAILGFNSAQEIFLESEFKDLGIETLITTVDGSYGLNGFVDDAMKHCGSYDYTFACGPEPMLRAVYNASVADGQYSFEARMGCGFGACMGCSCKTKFGFKRICKDGPVLEKREIEW